MNITRTPSLTVLFTLYLYYEFPVAVIAWAAVLAAIYCLRKTAWVVLGV